MRPVYAVATVLLTLAAAAQAQEIQQAEVREEAPAPDVRVAVPRAEAQAPAAQEPTRARAIPRPERPVAAAPAADDQRRGPATRGSRPRGDNPPTGIAVPRTGPAPNPQRGGQVDRRAPRVYRGAPPVFNNYSFPRRIYPYGYGAFGLGYFYYDPYAWGPGAWGPGAYGGYYAQPWGWGAPNGYPSGQLRLRVNVKHAEVLVDGYYAGTVDDFDGIAQGLRLEEGGYHIEIVAPGYETLAFDVHIQPGRKTTYRGELRRLP